MSPRRRTDYKPGDFVRCSRCGRLSLRRTSTSVNHQWYGSDCVLKAWASIEQAAADDRQRGLDQVPRGTQGIEPAR